MTEPLVVAAYSTLVGAVALLIGYVRGHQTGYDAGLQDGYRQGRRDEMKTRARAHLPYWSRGDEL